MYFLGKKCFFVVFDEKYMISVAFIYLTILIHLASLRFHATDIL